MSFPVALPLRRWGLGLTRAIGGPGPVVWLTATLALVVLGLVLALAPFVGVGAMVALTLLVATFLHPPVAAYGLLAATPLVVGINRDAFLPLLRPNEALAVLFGFALIVRGLVQLAQGHPLQLRLRTTDGAILLLLSTGSLLPLLWMVVRGEAMTQDDILYGLTLWKYYAVYLIVRTSIRTERQVQRCLWLCMAAGSVVALVGILQSLKLFGVTELLASLYAPDGDTGALGIRGTSTVAHAQAMADIMVFNLAVAAGFLVRGKSHRRWLLVALSVLFVFGSLASGQFSGALGLLVGVGAWGLVTGQLRRALLWLLPTLPVAGLALYPVISRRLSGFSSSAGMPGSWVARLDNLETYVLPVLGRDFNYVLGVRPAARIPLAGTVDEFIFIESGHAWLLWVGGLPFLLAFVLYLATNLRATARIARRRADAIGVAAIAGFVSLAVIAVLTAFDPHLTLRGAADLHFALLALSFTATRSDLRFSGA